MITLDQINPKLYPRECWINVYDIGYVWYGIKYSSRENAMRNIGQLRNRLIYRIHVRLK